jgi:hypothetical protein
VYISLPSARCIQHKAPDVYTATVGASDRFCGPISLRNSHKNHEPIPSTIELVSRPRYTPIFILIDNETEVGRIEGFPARDFFEESIENS